MDKKTQKELFELVAEDRYRRKADIMAIENELAGLRDGQPLEFRHLEKIADEELWEFNTYWEWPPREKIEPGLSSSAGIFASLPAKEEAVFEILLKIFKDIGLVSVLLRFAVPEHYGIYSYPPLYVLRVERAPSPAKDYKNYLKVLRALKSSFGMQRVADVDMLVWAVSTSNEVKYLDQLKEHMAKSLPENLSTEDLFRLLSTDPLALAGIYLEKGDYKTAGYWASRALEKYFLEASMQVLGYIPYSRDTGATFAMVERLSRHQPFKDARNKMHHLRISRNKAIHDSELFTYEDAAELIRGIRSLPPVKQRG